MKQIYAIGGGGFSLEPSNLALDKELLALSGKPKPKVCFISTASFDSGDYIDRFYRAFLTLDCEPSHLTVKIPNVASVRDHVMAQDILYVGGGDVLNLFDQWQKTRFDLVIKEAYEAGIVLAGVSAGAFCWFEAGMTDSAPGQFAPIKGLGLLKGSLCVHYDSEPERKMAYQRFMLRGLIDPGLALEDGVALHYVDGELRRAVSSREGAQAYRVEVRRNTIFALPEEPVYLG
ncbi:peptidase E [bacterium]|nr:peptidase E [bacterium]